MGSLAFLALFGRQDRERIVPGLEPRHPQSHYQHFALCHFGFDRREVEARWLRKQASAAPMQIDHPEAADSARQIMDFGAGTRD